ncbi:hypothetical protein IV102_29100 [bacterium]|nr:hypothetical protein [bacterium]
MNITRQQILEAARTLPPRGNPYNTTVQAMNAAFLQQIDRVEGATVDEMESSLLTRWINATEEQCDAKIARNGLLVATSGLVAASALRLVSPGLGIAVAVATGLSAIACQHQSEQSHREREWTNDVSLSLRDWSARLESQR